MAWASYAVSLHRGAATRTVESVIVWSNWRRRREHPTRTCHSDDVATDLAGRELPFQASH
jgi:hypothetical protein